MSWGRTGGLLPNCPNWRCPEYRGGRVSPGACPHAPKKEREREREAGGQREEHQQREREDGRLQWEANAAEGEEGEGRAGGEVERPDTRRFTPPQELQLVRVEDSGDEESEPDTFGPTAGLHRPEDLMRGWDEVHESDDDHRRRRMLGAHT